MKNLNAKGWLLYLWDLTLNMAKLMTTEWHKYFLCIC